MKRLFVLFMIAFFVGFAYGQNLVGVKNLSGAQAKARVNAAITATNTNTTGVATNVTNIATGVTAATTNQGLNKLMVDTVVVYSFDVGQGIATDSVFLNTGYEYDPIYWGGSDSIAITEIRCVMTTGETIEGTDTVSVNISWHATLGSGSAVNANTSALGVNSITTGTSDTSFDNATIPPGVFVWGEIQGTPAGRKPSQVVCTVMGYLKD